MCGNSYGYITYSFMHAPRGDHLALHGPEIAKYLAKNLSALATDRVLKEGETMRGAKAFWRGMAAVVRLLEAEASVVPGQHDTAFELSLRRLSR